MKEFEYSELASRDSCIPLFESRSDDRLRRNFIFDVGLDTEYSKDGSGILCVLVAALLGASNITGVDKDAGVDGEGTGAVTSDNGRIVEIEVESGNDASVDVESTVIDSGNNVDC